MSHRLQVVDERLGAAVGGEHQADDVQADAADAAGQVGADRRVEAVFGQPAVR